MLYEVFIPSTRGSDEFDVTITVEADNWMMALKSGLKRMGGSEEETIRNVMCDIKEDNSIHVTDASTRRVFVLKEITEETATEAPAEDESDVFGTQKMDALPFDESPPAPDPRPSGIVAPLKEESAPAAAPPIPRSPTRPRIAQPATFTPTPSVVVEQPAPSVVVEQPAQPSVVVEQPAAPQEPLVDSWTSDDGRMRIGSSSFEALQRDEPAARVLHETRKKTGKREAIGRSEEKVSENLLEEVFLEINRIHEGDMTMEEVVNYVMDLAMEKVRAEAGSVMFADVNGKELYFATARGPQAHAVMNFRVPMGTGIVGFCAREGVSLAISDAEHDPRFYRAISEALGYKTQSLCCAPIQFEGRVYGAIELLNKNNHHFTTTEVNALTYIGQQLARFVYELIMANEKLE